MKRLTLLHFVPALLLGVTLPASADTSAATVTQAVNTVSHGSSASTDTAPAPTGTKLHDGEYLKTGSNSRAELQLANQTITRLGANSIFNYSIAANEIDLQAGTMLFSKPKDGKEMTIKTASVTAAITGTTGVEEKFPGGGVLFCLIEGNATIVDNGISYNLVGGQMLVALPGQPPQIVSFDVPLLVKTSKLFKGFKGQLPNWKYIQDEIADYLDLLGRGFITPPKHPFFVYDNDGAPTIPIFNWDNPLTGLNQFNHPPPPPVFPNQPVVKECCWSCCEEENVPDLIVSDADVVGGGDTHHHHHGG